MATELKLDRVSSFYTDKKHHRQIVAVDSLSADFTAPMNVIVGFSGCGKTTLLRCLLGLQEYEGEIWYQQGNLDELSPKERNFSFVPQDYVLYPSYTVFDNIAFPLRLMHAEREEILNRVMEAAKLLEITPCLNRKPKHISGGQQQRTAIARALVKRPEVCLLDEPFSNVDPQLRMQTIRVLKSSFAAFGTMGIYVTHDMKEAMLLADEIFVMEKGKIVCQGTPSQIYDSFVPAVRDLLQSSEI